MGILQPTQDPTGALTEVGLNSQDISNIMAEFNKLQGQLTGGNIRQNQQNIIVFDNNTNRVLIGYQQVLQQWGLFVSQPGVDVTTANVNQLLFNSNQNIFRIVSSGTTSIPGFTVPTPGASYGNNNTTIAVPHGQSSIPAVTAFLDIFNSGTGKENYYALPYTSPSGFGTAAVWYNASFYVDDTNITFTQGALVYGTGTTFAAAPVKYYILAQTAN